jgi:hypothetical protein
MKHAYYNVTFVKIPLIKTYKSSVFYFFNIIFATQIHKSPKNSFFFPTFFIIYERERERPWKAFLRRSESWLGEGTISGSFNEAMIILS